MAKAGLHLTVACAECGSPFTQSRSDQAYCSKLCGARGWRKRQTKFPRKECRQCGKPFRPNGSQVFCGPECGRQWNADVRKVVGGPGKGWSGGKVTAPRRLCERCSQTFYAPPALIRRGGGRFCSVGCRAAEIARDPTKWPHTQGRRGKGGKRPDLGDRYFRSSWEANWARYLNWRVAQGQIRSWEYEVDTFEFPVKRGSRFYTPDFKLHHLDGSIEYEEVKGYMDQRSATKLKRMRIHYPAIRVTLIDKPVYQGVARMLSSALPNWEGRTRAA